MKRLAIAAVGLALVVGIVVGGMVNNLFGASAPRTSAASASGTGCYTNWNSADCAAGYTPVSTGEWTGVWVNASGVPGTGTLICAAPKTVDYPEYNMGFVSWNKGGEFGLHVVSDEPCAICCGTATYAVGGFAELPALAGAPGTGTSGMGGATYAVLAGAAAGVLAFAVLATLSVKRWRVR